MILYVPKFVYPFRTLAAEYENSLARDVTRHARQVLNESYPGYSWFVKVTGGVCFIKLLDSRLRGSWGMNKKLRDVDHDAEFFKRYVKWAAGEFLERAGLSRVRNMGDPIIRVDGIPQRYQPRPIDLPKNQVFENAPHILRAA